MRILVVYNSALDGKSMSGVLRYFSGVVKHWIANGHPTDFLVARAAWPVFAPLFPDSRLISSDDHFDATNHMDQTWRFLPTFAWRLFTCHFVKLPYKYDLVISCAQFIYEVYPTIVLARRSGNAAIAMRIHHVVSSQRRPRNVFDRMHIWSEKVTARLMNKRADAILCNTQLIADDYMALEKSLGLSPSKTFVTGCGADLDAIHASMDSPKSFDTILLGRLHETKGIFDAPMIWELVCKIKPDAKLIVVGDGPDRNELYRRFAEKGLLSNVEFSGSVSEAEKNSILERSRIGLSLSREEGWGLSVTEFLASGLPVVAMELPVFREIFPMQIDFVPVGDVDATAMQIAYWIEHPDEARQRGRSGRVFVERYDNRELARREIEIFHSALVRRLGRNSAVQSTR